MTGIDWALFWDLGGHGRYVWSGYGVAAAAFAAEALLLWRRARRSRREDAR